MPQRKTPQNVTYKGTRTVKRKQSRNENRPTQNTSLIFSHATNSIASLSLASVYVYYRNIVQKNGVFFAPAKRFVSLAKMNNKLPCCLCNSRTKALSSVFDVQVKVAKSDSISFFDAMKQLTGIEVSELFSHITHSVYVGLWSCIQSTTARFT